MRTELCVAVKTTDGELGFISICVDNRILLTPNRRVMAELNQALVSRFKMKDLGKVHYILGRSSAIAATVQSSSGKRSTRAKYWRSST